MATHSSTLAWKIPWTEEPGGYIPRGHKEADTTERLSTYARLANTRQSGGSCSGFDCPITSSSKTS